MICFKLPSRTGLYRVSPIAGSYVVGIAASIRSGIKKRLNPFTGVIATMKILFTTPARLVLAALLLTGCAHTGSRSPNARPVLYPNATFKQIGEARALEEVDICMGSAIRAGLTPDEKDNAVGHSAAKGAAVGGTLGAVGSLVRGRGADRAVGAGLRGAVVGGTVGAVAGSFQEKPNMTYRQFVQRCISERGLEVIGWN